MVPVSLPICLLLLIPFLNSVLATTLPSQNPVHSSRSKNITLTFDDLPTKDGFGTVDSYRSIKFSSFALLNTTAAALAGHISMKDIGCATSSHNALIAQKSKTPSLWPRIALSTLPGETPFFNLHGISMKPMNQSSSIVCISIQGYGIDEKNALRAYAAVVACFASRFRGGHLNISDILPGWGKAINMIEIHADTVVLHGEEVEWVDSPFCVDDIVVERLEGEEWEWPEPWWGRLIPLLPPLAPFRYDDQGGRTRGENSPFSERGRANFDLWREEGMNEIFFQRADLF